MSTETKWTPGEWVATDDGCGRWKVRVYEGHEPHAVRIASVPHTHGANDNNEQSKANAHLIAAAPELYEQLEALVDLFTSYQGLEMKLAKAALAKARGEQ